jgi:ATP/maltotriose-dependent transcriptional regulator MalT
LREAIYKDLLPGERRSLHLRMARALGEHPELAGAQASSAAELAHHWYAARQMPEALSAAVSAGAAAEKLGAIGDAWLHYQRALDIWDLAARSADELPFDRLELLRRAADAALLSGEEERAITLARELLARTDERDDPIQAALGYERLGRYLWTAGHDTDALPAYRRAVELIPHTPPSEARALALAAEGQVLMLCNRTTESIARCEEALAIARTIRAEAIEAHVLDTTCGNLSATGQFEHAITAARQALAIGRRLGLAEELSRSYVNGSDALDEAGRIEESIAMAREGIEAARELGFDRQWGDLLRGEVAGRLLQLERWNEAEQLLEEVIDRSPTGVNAAVAYRNLGFLWAERGAFDAAARALDQAEAQIHRSLGSMTLGPPAAARASLELWADRPEAASAVVSECLERVGESEYVFFTARVHELGTRACAEIAARAPADERTAEEQLAAARKLLERLDRVIGRLTGMIHPLVRASRAAAAAECSRIGQAGDAALWADARLQWDACGNRYQAAYAGWREAEALLASGGNRVEVKTLVGDAHAVADDLGARPLLEQLHALARRARIGLDDPRPSAAAPNPALERLELTPRELEVLALLASGLTNREIGAELFVTDKTASVHVSRILSKLSVPNRAAAAAVAQRLGVGATDLPR